MRVIHTSDWHVGRTPEASSRLPKQEQSFDQLCDIVSTESADTVPVAGDVFDSSDPPEAQELYHDAWEGLSAGGFMATIVMTRSHDSPECIRAADPLAASYEISLVGHLGEDLGPGGPVGGACRVGTGSGWSVAQISL